MALKFAREQAGEYNVSENGKMVAYIQKQNASKWITYFCSNPAVKGKPQNVAKTLKDSKAFCESYFENNDAAPTVSNEADNLDALIKNVRSTPTRKDMMREMLENPKTISFDDIDVESVDLSDIIDLGDETFTHQFLTEEEAMAL
jgi:hypothetical protein